MQSRGSSAHLGSWRQCGQGRRLPEDSSFSPVPTNLMGFPLTAFTDSAAPPAAVPVHLCQHRPCSPPNNESRQQAVRCLTFPYCMP